MRKGMHKQFSPTIQYLQPPKHVVDGWCTKDTQEQKHIDLSQIIWEETSSEVPPKYMHISKCDIIAKCINKSI